jgi:hypothetical protein
MVKRGGKRLTVSPDLYPNSMGRKVVDTAYEDQNKTVIWVVITIVAHLPQRCNCLDNMPLVLVDDDDDRLTNTVKPTDYPCRDPGEPLIGPAVVKIAHRFQGNKPGLD